MPFENLNALVVTHLSDQLTQSNDDLPFQDMIVILRDPTYMILMIDKHRILLENIARLRRLSKVRKDNKKKLKIKLSSVFLF